ALSADGVTAETDGPPGALYLARALASLDFGVVLITDRCAMPLLEAGCELLQLDCGTLVEFPFEAGDPDSVARACNLPGANAEADRCVEIFFARVAPGPRRLTHLTSIERPGPSHTLESLGKQARRGGAPVERFDREVPSEVRNICHNMRGLSINGWTAK